MPPWSRQQALQNVCNLIMRARTQENKTEADRLLGICVSDLDRIFRSCVAARGMYATNKKLRNHIANIAPRMLEAKRQLQEILETGNGSVHLRKIVTDLGQITFIPDDEPPKAT